jgi:hypothetical protein
MIVRLTTAAAVLALALPAAGLATSPPAPGSIVITFDCKHNPVAIIAGGELVFSQDPDPTCPAGPGYDLVKGKIVP